MSIVSVDINEGVAHVQMNAAHNGNALSDAMVSELTTILRQVDQNPQVRSIMLSAAGKNFCAGGDLNDFRAAQSKPLEQGYRDIEPSMALFSFGLKIRTPIVAAVGGASRGGGLGLIAMAHVAVARPDATFALPEVKLGLFPFGIFPLLSRAMGPRRTLELALSSRVFGADDALAYGLIHQVSDDVQGSAEEIAIMLASRSNLAISTGLEAFNHLTDPGSWPLDYVGLLRLLTFKSEALAQNVERFLHPHQQYPDD
ncbi:MAG: enoyl-CoA hydratase/isomerase family protein [Sulfobacillus sp.]